MTWASIGCPALFCSTLGRLDFMRLPSPAARITTCSGAVMREPWMESLNSNGARITMPATPASGRPHARRFPRRPAPPVPRRPRARMSLGRQGRHYLFIGGIQWLVAWGVMVALSPFGMGLGPANVPGRIHGALLVSWADGNLPFAGDPTLIARPQPPTLPALFLLPTLIPPLPLHTPTPTF